MRFWNRHKLENRTSQDEDFTVEFVSTYGTTIVKALPCMYKNTRHLVARAEHLPRPFNIRASLTVVFQSFQKRNSAEALICIKYKTSKRVGATSQIFALKYYLVFLSETCPYFLLPKWKQHGQRSRVLERPSVGVSKGSWAGIYGDVWAGWAQQARVWVQ